MHKKLVTLLASVVAALFVIVGLSATTAQAASPHYVQGPSVSTSGNTLTVSWKAAGLGNTATANFTLTGTVTAMAQCYTKSGNPVNGVPKSDTTMVNASGTFDVRNGQVTGSLAVSPLTTLTCTGSQRVRILSVTYDLYLNGAGLPEARLTYP
jgi:hypothetical protein